MKLLGYSIASDFPELPVKEKTVINTINPHSYCVAKRDSEFEIALHASDVLLPDGLGIVLAAKIVNRKKIHKIAGFDIFLYLMQYLDTTVGSCFFLGASENTLALIKARAFKEFPNVNVNVYSPPYKPQFTIEDSEAMCRNVNNHKPQVLFVGMTAPKQEKWVHEHKDKINAQIMCSIGAVFDFYAGTVNRAPNWIVNLGLEWLHRSMVNPRRLGVRNLTSNPEFILDVFKDKFKLINK